MGILSYVLQNHHIVVIHSSVETVSVDVGQT